MIFVEKLKFRKLNSIRPGQHARGRRQRYMCIAERLYAGEKAFAESWNFGIGGGDWSEDRLLPDVFRSHIFGEKL